MTPPGSCGRSRRSGPFSPWRSPKTSRSSDSAGVLNECAEGWHAARLHALHHLAAAYADHPDYRQEWTP
ncbi:DUF6221 family protein [Nocardiopsis sp. NPDC101807]|uniref:DUF6221 family protein n=1 Tax=Nocardiopsis sp. NPDC101807 TaxID=3364339 RepID=UPI0038170B15